MFKPLADYTYNIVDGVVVIVDLDKGGRSVTNDAEQVIEEVRGRVKNITDYPVVYSDSQGNFDGMRIDGDGRFDGFIYLGETDLVPALIKIKEICCKV